MIVKTFILVWVSMSRRKEVGCGGLASAFLLRFFNMSCFGPLVDTLDTLPRQASALATAHFCLLSFLNRYEVFT